MARVQRTLSFLASLDDETTLHFLYRVEEGGEDDLREYEAICGGADGPGAPSPGT